MRQLLIVGACVILSGCFAAAKKGKISVEQDAFTKKTMVRWEALVQTSVNAGGQIAANMLVGSSAEGKDASLKLEGASPAPEKVALEVGFYVIQDGARFVNSESIQWRYKSCHTVELLAGDIPVAVEGEPKWDGQVDSSGFRETIKAEISSDGLIALSSASVVRARFCKTVVELTPEQMKTFKQFAEKLALKSRQPTPTASSVPASTPASQP